MEQGISPDFSPLQVASITPSPALLVSNPTDSGSPGFTLVAGRDISLTRFATGCNMLI